MWHRWTGFGPLNYFLYIIFAVHTTPPLPLFFSPFLAIVWCA